jgi:hypothetical protein
MAWPDLWRGLEDLEQPGLSPQERQDVIADAKKVKSRPRLRQSGHLFGQQYFVQQACLKKGKAQGAV